MRRLSHDFQAEASEALFLQDITAGMQVALVGGVQSESFASDAMNREEYNRYLGTPEWKQRREGLIRAHGSKCWTCGIPRGLAVAFDGQDLNVHHLKQGYDRIALNEPECPEDVEVHCRVCHFSIKRTCDARTFRDEMEWRCVAWAYWLLRFRFSDGRSSFISQAMGDGRTVAEEAKRRAATIGDVDSAFATAIVYGPANTRTVLQAVADDLAARAPKETA